MTPVETLAREAVRALPPYRGLTSRRPAVQLDGNENPLGPAPAVIEALRELDPRVVSRYPAPALLRERWAARLGVKPAEVLLTSGSGPALALAAELVLEPGDGCVIAAPCFELYGWAAQRRGARITAVPCEAARRFAFPAEGFRHAIEDSAVPPRLVIIGLPDNPTGAAPPVEFITSMARAHPRTLFLVDEAYVEFSGTTVVPHAVKRPNLLVTRTFSKALGLAGERIGGIIGNAELIDLLARINVPYPVTATATALGLAALSDAAHVRRTVELSRRAVRRIAREVAAAGLPAIPTRANFVLVGTGSHERATALTAALARRDVAIRNRSHLPGMAGWVRISAGTDEELDRCLDALRLLAGPPPDALLFDMDHVLVDVSRSYDEAIVRTVTSFLPAGRTASRDEILAVKRRADADDDIDASVIALRRLGLTPPRREVEKRFQSLYQGTKGKPGLYRSERWLLPLPALKKLAARFPLAIVTGRTRQAGMALRRSGAAKYFTAVITTDDVQARKPDPAPLRAAVKRLGARNPWMVGDGPADLLAASRARIPAVGIRGEGEGAAARERDLRQYRPLAVLAAARELEEFFAERDRIARESGA